jgi:type I restriction enzyme S subunit
MKLGDLIDIKHGFAFPSEHFCPEGPHVLLTPGNFYEAGGFKSKSDQKHYDGPVPEGFVLRPGSLLVAMTEQGEGLLGSAAFVPEGRSCLHNQRLGLVTARADVEVDLTYIYYVLNWHDVRQQIRGTASGAKIRHTSPSRIGAVEIPHHTLTAQRRIASILRAYDELIEVNRRRVAVLEEMARALFEEWFVRFRFPGHETVPMADTPEGPLPNGWSWRAFSSLAEFMNGFAFKPTHFEDHGWPIIKIPELKNGITHKTPRNSGSEVPERYSVNDGDLLFSWSGTFAVSEWTCGPGLLNQHLFLVRPELGVERGLLKAALRWAIPLFDNQGVGATMKHIRRSALDHVRIPYPDDAFVRDRANALFRSSYELCVSIRKQTQKLAASRDLLHPRLISGQLSVEAAELALELELELAA